MYQGTFYRCEKGLREVVDVVRERVVVNSILRTRNVDLFVDELWVLSAASTVRSEQKFGEWWNANNSPVSKLDTKHTWVGWGRLDALRLLLSKLQK